MSVKKGDLIYHEGPLLSHFEGDDGNQYFFKWADSTKSINRWLVFQVTYSELMLFFNQKITLKDLVLNEWKQHVFLFEIDSNLKLKKATRKKIDKIPEEYLPLEKSFYDSDHYESYAQKLSDSIKKNKSRLSNSNKEKFSIYERQLMHITKNQKNIMVTMERLIEFLKQN